MSGLAKTVFRLPSIRTLSNPVKSTIGKREFTRTLWHMCKRPEDSIATGMSSTVVHSPSMFCKCGCGSKRMHTKGERELVEFLTEEIIAERKAQKIKTIPSEIDGFKVKINGAEVEMTKTADKESITVSFNINHTVDADEEADIDPTADKPNFAEMKSRPQFEVDIVRGGTTLSFTCSFLQGEPAEGEYNDVFGIDEITIYSGEWNDKVYAVAGDVLDGYLYDLLMNILEEKGISNEFVEKLSEFSTAYEHSSYIGLLENLSKFTTGK